MVCHFEIGVAESVTLFGVVEISRMTHPPPLGDAVRKNPTSISLTPGTVQSGILFFFVAGGNGKNLEPSFCSSAEVVFQTDEKGSPNISAIHVGVRTKRYNCLIFNDCAIVSHGMAMRLTPFRMFRNLSPPWQSYFVCPSCSLFLNGPYKIDGMVRCEIILVGPLFFTFFA